MRYFRKIKAVAHRSQIWLAIGLIPLLSSCASTSRETVLRPARPFPVDSDGSNLRTRGFLVAYTPAELHFDDKGSRFYRHTGYQIFWGNTDQPFRYVPNHLGKTDEAAVLVNLPSGPYRIQTQTVYGEPVTVSILIRPSVITTVNLESDSKPPVPLLGDLFWVRLDGHRVGWITESPTAWPEKQIPE